jgi:hypothetical protein
MRDYGEVFASCGERQHLAALHAKLGECMLVYSIHHQKWSSIFWFRNIFSSLMAVGGHDWKKLTWNQWFNMDWGCVIGSVVLAIMHLLYFLSCTCTDKCTIWPFTSSYLFVTLITHQVKIRLDYLFRRFERSFFMRVHWAGCEIIAGA